MKVVEIKCPGCGERLSLEMKSCPSCHKPVLISSLGNVFEMTNVEANKYAMQYQQARATDPTNNKLIVANAFCFLKLKYFDKAGALFEKAIENDICNPDLYFYFAICLLQGKKPFLLPRSVINKVLDLMCMAISIEPKGVYYYLVSCIKYDYFERKCYAISPNSEEELETAKKLGLTECDIVQLQALVHKELVNLTDLDD